MTPIYLYQLILCVALISSQSIDSKVCPENQLAIPIVQLNSQDVSSLGNNESIIILPKSHGRIKLACTAPYPIELIRIGEASTVNRTRGNFFHRFGEELRLNIENFTKTFQIQVDLKIRSHIDKISTFSCQSIVNSCLRQQIRVTSPKEDHLEFSVLTENTPDLKEDGLTLNSTCQSIFYYELSHETVTSEVWPTTKIPGYSFRCQMADGRLGSIKRRECSTSISSCNSVKRQERQDKNCIQPFMPAQTCKDCESTVVSDFSPFVATCSVGSEESDLGNLIVFGLPQSLNDSPKIFLTQEEIEPKEMLVMMDLTSEPKYPDDEIEVTCVYSYFYYLKPFRLILEFKGGQLQEIPVDPKRIEWDRNLNAKYQKRKIKIPNSTIERIYCLAAGQRDGQWHNVSRSISVIEPETLKIIFDSDSSQWPSSPGNDTTKTEKFQKHYSFHKGQLNNSIFCGATGIPVPKITWTDTSGVKPKGSWAQSQSLNSFSWSELTFLTKLDETITYKFNCIAENQFSSVKETIWVHFMNDQEDDVGHISSKANNGSFLIVIPIVVIIILILIFIVVILYRKNRIQGKFIRNLTEDEIKEFRQGTSFQDPNDVHSSIYARPFDPSLEIPRDLIHLEQGIVLGSGEFGIVIKGSLTADQNIIPVAIKMIRPNVEVVYFKALLSEVKIMGYIGRHENIVSLLGACTVNIKNRDVLVAIEFCELGDLRNYLQKHKDTYQTSFKSSSQSLTQLNDYENTSAQKKENILTELQLLTWALEICNGMIYLSDKKVIHGDLAARNVLLTDQKVAKLSDFGLSRQLVEYSNYVKKEQCALPFKWLSLESLKHMEFSVKSDIWAYGVTLYELLTLGGVPYPGRVWNHDFLTNLEKGYRMEKPLYADDDMYKIMWNCWLKVPNERPNFTQIHQQIQKILSNHNQLDYISIII